MKPPAPPKPVEKLPFTYHLTLVPSEDPRMRTLVATKMQGNEIKVRKVLHSFDSRQEALDELNRIATRLFYFEVPEEIFGDEA
jgi:hypothetical protein